MKTKDINEFNEMFAKAYEEANRKIRRGQKARLTRVHDDGNRKRDQKNGGKRSKIKHQLKKHTIDVYA